jgi:hypothetical protein
MILAKVPVRCTGSPTIPVVLRTRGKELASTDGPSYSKNRALGSSGGLTKIARSLAADALNRDGPQAWRLWEIERDHVRTNKRWICTNRDFRNKL